MAKNYAEIAFSPASKVIQKQMGSLEAYERKYTPFEGLTERETKFISSSESFYMATAGENGYPYIQHRGGPAGFLKILDPTRIGFLDFKGNRQYITVGNLTTNAKVSLFLMDYAAKRRLKIYATAELVDLHEDEGLLDFLTLKDYPASAERVMVFHIEAFDWNCPKYIPVRYSAEDVQKMTKEQNQYISKLEAEIETLKIELQQKNLR
jgi:predicted pyridoxine 5'-phosphate oxidase superfamily flavin-nucleotide-binding protein